MSDRIQNIQKSRRAFLRGAAVTAGVVALSSVDVNGVNFGVNVIKSGIALAADTRTSRIADMIASQCSPAVVVKDYCPRTAAFVMYGERLVNGINTGETAEKVDLRLSLAQDPTKTYKWGTFKLGEHQEREGFATLIEMGPVINNGTEHGKPKLDLYSKRFVMEGCYAFDFEALVEECGKEVLRPAWKVDVERIVKEDGKRVFRYEYSFGVVPDCGDAVREYIDNVTRRSAPSTPVPQAPATNTGTPGRQPAQIPLLPGTGGGAETAPTTPIHELPHITPWPGTAGR